MSSNALHSQQAPSKRKFVSAQTVSPIKLKRMGIGLDDSDKSDSRMNMKSSGSSVASDLLSSGGDVSGSGLLEGVRPADVSQAQLEKTIQKATSPKELFGNVSNAELIDLTFLWFGCSSIDLPWFDDDGKPTIVASPHNRPLQDWK